MMTNFTSPQKRILKETDLQRRQSEKRAVGGDARDQARVLQDRMRRGELSWERVNGAASLGDPASIQVIGKQSLYAKNWTNKFQRIMRHTKLSWENIRDFADDCVDAAHPASQNWFINHEPPWVSRRGRYTRPENSGNAYIAAGDAARIATGARDTGVSEEWINNRLIDYLLGRNI